MDFLELAADRYSVRKFKPTPIPEDVMARILGALQLAPSACNYQPVKVYVVASESGRHKLATLTKYTFEAPVVCVICYDSDREWKNPQESGIHSGVEDASIAACHMMFAAWECGIGSCWVNAFPNSLTALALGLPDNMKPVLLLPMGYPAEGARPSRLHGASCPLEDLAERM